MTDPVADYIAELLVYTHSEQYDVGVFLQRSLAMWEQLSEEHQEEAMFRTIEYRKYYDRRRRGNP